MSTARRIRAEQESLSLEETVRRLLQNAAMDEKPVGAVIRRIAGDDGFDLDPPAREADDPIDFTSLDYGEDDHA